jgi:hypothetical protein
VVLALFGGHYAPWTIPAGASSTHPARCVAGPGQRLPKAWTACRRAARCAGAAALLLALSLASHAEPVGHEAAASSVAEDTLPPLPVDEHPDAATAAERAAIDALLHGQARRDRQAVLLQTYLGRPPTWIQSASLVNLAEFPRVGDPTADAERQFDDVAWLAQQRLRAPPASARTADPGLDAGDVFAVDDPGWLDMLLPSTWAPLLREHRDQIVAAGAALLLTGWGFNLLVQRAVARAARRRRRRRRHESRHAKSDHRRAGDSGTAGTARDGHHGGAGSPDEQEREARRRLRRRRRHRRRSGVRQADKLAVPTGPATAGP